MPSLHSMTQALLASLAFVAGLAGSAVLMSVPALAQLTAAPQSLSVTPAAVSRP